MECLLGACRWSPGCMRDAENWPGAENVKSERRRGSDHRQTYPANGRRMRHGNYSLDVTVLSLFVECAEWTESGL